jgi:hypothetical protein
MQPAEPRPEPAHRVRPSRSAATAVEHGARSSAPRRSGCGDRPAAVTRTVCRPTSGRCARPRRGPVGTLMTRCSPRGHGGVAGDTAPAARLLRQRRQRVTREWAGATLAGLPYRDSRCVRGMRCTNPMGPPSRTCRDTGRRPVNRLGRRANHRLAGCCPTTAAPCAATAPPPPVAALVRLAVTLLCPDGSPTNQPDGVAGAARWVVLGPVEPT